MQRSGDNNAAKGDRPRQRHVEPAGQDHRPLPERQHDKECGQNQQRVPIVEVQNDVAEHELRGDEHKNQANIGGKGVANDISMTAQERRLPSQRPRSTTPRRPANARRRSVWSRCETRKPARRAPTAAARWRICSESTGLSIERSQEHCEQQNHAFGDGGEISRNVQRQQDVDDIHQDQRTDYAANRAAFAASESRPADDDRRKYREQQRVANKRIARPGLRADEHAGQSVDASCKNVRSEQHIRYANASGCRRRAVASHRVECDSIGRALQPGPEKQYDDQQHHRARKQVRNGIPHVEVAQRRRDLAAGLLHDKQRCPLDDEHR